MTRAAALFRAHGSEAILRSVNLTHEGHRGSNRISHKIVAACVAVNMNSKSRLVLGNALASVLFLVVAIVDFTRDSSGIGVVFLVFAGVWATLAFSAREQEGRDSD